MRVAAGNPPARRFFGDADVHSGSDVDSFATTGGDHRGQFVAADDAFEFARDAASLDFAIAAEHDLGLTSDTWLANQRRVDALDQPGRFVTLLGYEWTSDPRIGRHTVVYEGAASEKNALVAATSGHKGATSAGAEKI